MSVETLAPPDSEKEELVLSEYEKEYRSLAHAAFTAISSVDARAFRERAAVLARQEKISTERQRAIGRAIFVDLTRQANGGRYIFKGREQR